MWALFRPTLVVFLLFAAVAVRAADAPLARTGQLRVGGSIEAPFADGTIRSGIAWVQPRFTDNGDGTSTDEVTGLVWVRDLNMMILRDPSFDTDGTAGDGYVTWSRALAYVAKLNAESYASHNDWRLPNVNEVESVLNMDSSWQQNWLDGTEVLTFPVGQPFLNPHYVWTSTTYAADTTKAWFHDVTYGSVGPLAKSGVDLGKVWPVRGPLAFGIRLARTGQTTSAMAGDDGAVRAGVAWPSPRFTDNADGTVTDNLTGLMWTKDALAPGPQSCRVDSFGMLPWNGTAAQPTLPSAMTYLACLNALPNGYLGHNDWRMPNRLEMLSLVDRSRSNPALPAGHPFTNVQSSLYWTSTDHFADNQMFSDWAWYVDLSDGKSDGDNKLVSRFVWPVRGGSLGEPVATLTDPDPVTPPFWTPFAPTAIGATATRTLTITNSGTSPLVIGQITPDAGTDFLFSASDCSRRTIAPGLSCAITVAFSPTASGIRNGGVTIPSNAPGSYIERIYVAGDGVSPGITVVVRPAAGGTVSGTGIACPGDCFETASLGATFSLNAAVQPGFVFHDWSGCTSVTGTTCSVTVSGANVVTATFAAARADANGDGDVSPADLVSMIDHLFGSGAPMTGSGDADGDGTFDIADVFFLINFFFSGGEPPA